LSEADVTGQRVLVTGGAGFIGSHLVDGLVEAGASEVKVVDDLSLGRLINLEAALARPGVSFAELDCADLAALSDALEGSFDCCFNLAVIPLPHSLQHPRENVDRNVMMTTAVCELHRQGRFRRLVQYSSSEAYGSAHGDAPMSEVHPLRPHTPYAAAKAATDLIALTYARTFNLETVVVRPFNTYGERQNAGAYAGLIPIVVRRVLAGEPVIVYGDGEQTRDLTHVSDTVAGTLLASISSQAPGDIFNLGYGRAASVNEVVVAILNLLDRPQHPVVHAEPRPGDVRTLLADTSKAQSVLGYAPRVDLNEGIRRTVDWYVRISRSAGRG
jgi:UDP-glucose 4-epimerase